MVGFLGEPTSCIASENVHTNSLPPKYLYLIFSVGPYEEQPHRANTELEPSARLVVDYFPDSSLKEQREDREDR